MVVLFLGPGFQFVLEYFEFNLFGGALEVRPFNAPGLFMALLWISFLIFVLGFYHNLDVEHKYELLRKEEHGQELAGYSVELSASLENIRPLSDNRPSRAARRWYFIEESFNKESVHCPVTFRTYIDGISID